MSKTKDKSYLRKVGGTGSTAGIRDLLRNYAVGQTGDILDRLMFLQRQHSLIVRNLCADWNKGDLEAFFKTAGKCFLRMDRLRMKMKELLQRMPSREANEQDLERILTILDRKVPGLRDKIIQGMKKGENRNQSTPGEGRWFGWELS